MPVAQLPIANGFYRSDSRLISDQECTNLYPVVEDSQALSQETLRGTPGLLPVATVGLEGDTTRGAITFMGKPHFIIGDSLYELDAFGTATQVVGPAIPGSGPVSVAENGTQMVIVVPGDSGYHYDGTTFQQITDGDFTANGLPTAVVFIDGYFLYTTTLDRIIISNLNQGLVYSALDFASVESSPDGVVAPVVYRNQLFVGGEQTFEAFSNIGGAGFPFQRVNLFLTQGIAGRFSVQVSFNTFIWIGAGRNESASVWLLSGNETQKVSNRAVDSLLGNLTTTELSEITSWTYTQDGHFFVGWNLPQTTIVYDFSTGRWHERTSRLNNDRSEYQLVPFRGRSIVSAFGRLYCGDSQDGRIGELSLDVFDEYGEEIERVVSTAPFANNMKPFSVPYVELTMESGVGDQVTDPVIEMQVSKDGGYNYTQFRSRSLGKAGEYQRRAVWRRLGRFDRFVMFRFRMSDKVKPVIAMLTGEVVQ